MSFFKKTVSLLIMLYIFSAQTYAQSYQVKPGDTLFFLARRFNTTISHLQTINNLAGSMIYPGQVLQINSSPQYYSSSWQYTVKPSDTLFLLSKRYGVTVSQLMAANNLQTDYLWVGQTLKIPRANQSPAQNIHTVSPGESLYLLAKKYGVTIYELQKANNLTGTMIYSGQKLVIPKNNSPVPSPGYQLSQSDMELLARLVTAEAGGESYEGKVAVAATVLNRLESPRYPHSIPAIVYQVVDGKYQYSPVLDGRINISATSDAIRAVRDALAGWDPTYGATGFYNPAKTSNWWVRSQKVTAIIGNHTFFIY